MEIFKPDMNIDFIGKRRLWLSISVILTIASFVLFFTIGPNYGIDFAGGVEVKVEFKQDPGIGKIRNALGDIKSISGLEVQKFVIPNKHVYSIKAKGEIETSQLSEQLTDIASSIFQLFKGEFGEDNVSVVSTDVVGPKVGKELRGKAFWAIVVAIIAMLIYIGFRFDYRTAPGAILALSHDVILTTGFLIVLNREISLTIIAALLTVAGYSINDKIVVFDRIREGKTKHAKLPLEQRVNRSVNETIARTLLTGVCTLLVLIALLLFGGEIVRDFSSSLIFGILIGTYSSIYIASPIYIFLEKRFATRAKRHGRR